MEESLAVRVFEEGKSPGEVLGFVTPAMEKDYGVSVRFGRRYDERKTHGGGHPDCLSAIGKKLGFLEEAMQSLRGIGVLTKWNSYLEDDRG